MSASDVINLSAYRFAPLAELKRLRAELAERCAAWRLKGTILLSGEGINVFVAGARADVEALVAFLQTIPGLETLAPKYSPSREQPFRRMLVKIKKEIIAFGVEGIDPSRRTVPKLSAQELKRWLDEGRPVMLLDTRNDYEVRLGTFKGAVPAGIGHFRDFPAAVARLPETMKRAPIVMFCTGGIRCEKAGPYLEREGFTDVHQLDGGILKYFEEVGSAHYEGECFVFDQRVGVDPALHETDSVVCFHCQAPLTAAEQAHPFYQPPHSCPRCHRTTDEERAATLAQRHEALRRAGTPLPGSVPYENRRPFLVPPARAGATLLDCADGLFPQFTREAWLLAAAAGQLRDAQDRPCGAHRRVQPGERYTLVQPAWVEPEVSAAIRILHEDAAIIVLAKPAPLPMHPSGRFNRNTLEYLLNQAYAPYRPRAAHRLDANTTGVVICARTRQIAGDLQPQFARGDVEKVYLARIAGNPATDEFACDAPITDEPGETGTREIATNTAGLGARTEFRVLERAGDGTTLLEVRPRTGRTNQIRVHLWHLGLPIVGDPSYLPDGRIGGMQTLPVGAPPLCLHAWKISFAHPATNQRVSFEAEPPEWAGT